MTVKLGYTSSSVPPTLSDSGGVDFLLRHYPKGLGLADDES